MKDDGGRNNEAEDRWKVKEEAEQGKSGECRRKVERKILDISSSRTNNTKE